MTKEALIIVDPQNDFCPGGSLAVKEGDQVIEPLNRLSKFCYENDIPVFISRDWHTPDNTAHMGPNKWPLHCIQGTNGAEFHPDLDVIGATIVSKGVNYQDDGYSAFEGKTLEGRRLADVLHQASIGNLIVGGLATDYCVKATVIDALNQGFTVRVIRETIKAVDLHPGDGHRAILDMEKAGARIVDLVYNIY